MSASIAVTATFNAATSTYGPWQSYWCDFGYGGDCWSSTEVDTCNGDDLTAYACPSGASKTCNDVVDYEYYIDDEWEFVFWGYRTIICVP
jgi:hypothetical protein